MRCDSGRCVALPLPEILKSTGTICGNFTCLPIDIRHGSLVDPDLNWTHDVGVFTELQPGPA